VSLQKKRNSASSLRHPPQPESRKETPARTTPTTLLLLPSQQYQRAMAIETAPGQNEPSRPKPAKSPKSFRKSQPDDPATRRQLPVPQRRLDISPRSAPVKWITPEFQKTRNPEKPKTIKALKPKPQSSRPEIRCRGIGEGASHRQSHSAKIREKHSRFAPTRFLPLRAGAERCSRKRCGNQDRGNE
jgi:hypothetical protein